MAIAHRSEILECFACVELVLTTIMHRFVGVCMYEEGERNVKIL